MLKQRGGEELDIRDLGLSSSESAGGSRRRGGGGTSASTFEAARSISQTPYRASRYSAELQNPAPGSSPVRSVHLRCQRASTFDRLRRASPTAPIPSCRSRHAAPRGFPPPPARGLPPRRACARFNSTRRAGAIAPTQRHCSDRLGSLHTASVKSKRQSRFRIKAMPVAQTRPAPGLARPRPERFPSCHRNQRAISLFRYAVEIVPTRFKVFSLVPRCDPP